jgi:putative transcriptional regulator
MKSLISFKDYGSIRLNIGNLMECKGISISKMVKLTGMHHKVILRYCNNEASRYDADILAKFCYVLDCDVYDVLQYSRPE